jgi:hypothetical protein
MSIAWDFPEKLDGREGFNSTGISIFAGGQVQSFVREVIQNSLDARLDPTKPVELDFSLLDQPRENYPEIVGLLPYVQKAQEAEVRIKASTNEGLAFYSRAVAKLSDSKRFRMLAIHDFNTKGLDGDTVDTGEEEIDGWLGLVKGSGITRKSAADSLGSFGQGAKAPFAISGLRTLFYLTRVIHNGTSVDRFQGKSILQSMSLGDEKISAATGFFGKVNRLQPLLDDEIPGWAKESRAAVTSQTGTTIFIAEPYLDNDPDKLWLGIKIAVIANFYYAILKNNLKITLGDGSVFSSESVQALYESLGLYSNLSSLDVSEDIKEAIESVQTIHEASLDGGLSGELQSEHFGEIQWYMRIGDGVSGRSVGVARQTGMLITRSAEELKRFLSGVKPFDLFVCVVGRKGSEILKGFENPEHNKFEFKRISDEDARKTAVKAYKGFVKEVKDLIQELAGYQITEESRTGDLSDIFGGISKPSEGADDNEMSLRLRLGKAKKRPQISQIGVEIETETGNGSGNSGGDKNKVNKGGNNPDENGEGAADIPVYKANRVIDFRVVPGTTAPDGYRMLNVHFTSPIDGSAKFEIFKVGEVSREPIPFRTRVDGALVGFTTLNALKKGKRSKYVYYVEESVLNFALEGMLRE